MKHSLFLLACLFLALGPDNGDLDVVKWGNTECGLEGNPNGSEAQKDLDRHKNRYDISGEEDIDPQVSLPAMLVPGNDVKRFDPEKAARITGFVVNVKSGGKESCNCDARAPDAWDTHIELGLADGVAKTQRVIVEITPRLRILKSRAGENWTTEVVSKQFKGKWVEVTGWLLFDTAHIRQAENTHPGNKTNFRATCWEIHPVTDIKVVPDPTAELAEFQPAGLTALQRLHARHIENAPNGKKAVARIHHAQLAKFSSKEKKEAQEEAEARFKEP
jgi:hypothetical protein